MKKLYIILGFKTGLSGGQIYVYNKTRYLEKQGWDVVVVDNISQGKIYIPYFYKFKDNSIQELRFKPDSFRKDQREKVVDKVLKCAGYSSNYTEVVIESNTIYFSLWGELIAKKIGAKHISMLIDAFFTESMKKGCMEYFNFKLERKELAGINKNSLNQLFDGYRELKDNERYCLRAVCTNSVENVEYPKEIDKSKYDYIIGSVGRLDKPFVPQMAEEIKKFCEKNNDKKILLILIGGAFDNKVERSVTDKFMGIPNLQLEVTGLIFPIPLDLLNLLDVNIASSGSASVTARINIKTIVVDDTSVSPLGVVGYSVRGIPYIDYKGYDGSLCQLLEDVLLNNYCDKFDYVNIIPDINVDAILSKHIEFIENSSKINEYFDVTHIKPVAMKERLYYFPIKLFGYENTKKVIKLIKEVFRSGK